MAGLVPAIPIRETLRVRQFYVYILASRPGGALYVGVTNNLIRRVYQHKKKMINGHTKYYGIDRLVHFEIYDTAYQSTGEEYQTLAASVEDATYCKRKRYVARLV
jgi:predicted GIY-YIG superfamily endonuclease